MSDAALACPPARHVVQFYRNDDELVAAVGDYLAPGIRGGEAAVIVATAPHRMAFEAALTAQGVDVSAARACGAYIALDAEHTMRQFLVGDWPERVGFELSVRTVIRRAGAGGRPVRVYGEIVALLWDAGHVNAAIELESLWNELGRQLPFTLFCGYSVQSVTGDDRQAAFADVCRLHSAVVGQHPEPATPPDPPGEIAAAARAFRQSVDSPRAARHFVLETLQGWAHDSLLDDAALIVTELATNAVLHARSEFSVHISTSHDTVRIGVRDACPVYPTRRDASLVAMCGRGLDIVAALADHWAVEPIPSGKTVWAQLRRSV